MNKLPIIILVIIIIALAAGIAYLFYKVAAVKPEQSASNNETNQNNNSNNFEIQNMKVEILKQGTGEEAKTGDNVVVNYVGTLTDGTKFDSSIDRGQPFPFTLGVSSVIQGWQLGVAGMKVGEKRRLTIPPELGYGAAGAGGVIPPNATLIFEIDMLGINQ